MRQVMITEQGLHLHAEGESLLVSRGGVEVRRLRLGASSPLSPTSAVSAPPSKQASAPGIPVRPAGIASVKATLADAQNRHVNVHVITALENMVIRLPQANSDSRSLGSHLDAALASERKRQQIVPRPRTRWTSPSQKYL